jgi:uncharacterized protein YdaU (DUF1376 family)
MKYYRHDFLVFSLETQRLTILERGIFRDLIDIYLTYEKPITGDIDAIMLMLTMRTQDEKDALLSVLNYRFVYIDGVYRSEICDGIIAEYQCFIAKKTHASALGVAARKTKNKPNLKLVAADNNEDSKIEW